MRRVAPDHEWAAIERMAQLWELEFARQQLSRPAAEFAAQPAINAEDGARRERASA